MMKKNYFRYLAISSKAPYLWILVGLEFLFIYAFHGLFSVSVEKLMEISGGVGLPDLELYYTVGQLHNIFLRFGDLGRSMYLKLQYIDMVYPLIYASLLASLLFLLIKNTRLENLIFLPALAAFFDYAENILLRINILAFPNMEKITVQFASAATLLKWSMIFLSVVVILGAALRHFFILIKKNKS